MKVYVNKVDMTTCFTLLYERAYRKPFQVIDDLIRIHSTNVFLNIDYKHAKLKNSEDFETEIIYIDTLKSTYHVDQEPSIQHKVVKITKSYFFSRMRSIFKTMKLSQTQIELLRDKICLSLI